MIITLLFAITAVVNVDFDKDTGRDLRPELHSSGFGAQICSCPQANIDAIKAMGFKASRTHDWALINPNQRVCDWHMIFPLADQDATNPAFYRFDETDYLLQRNREELGHDIFFRLGTSIEHSGPKVHFNALIPKDFDKVAEVFAGTVRHYNRGWANGHEWNIRYWEIWNEPDGVENMWCLPEGDIVYPRGPETAAEQRERNERRMRLFCDFFVRCLKRLKTEFGDSIKVGGPAMCAMNEAYFTELLKACKVAGVAPDFISWHHYTCEPNVMMNAIAKGRELCDRFGFPKCELIINEWHFFGEYTWGELRSSDPETLQRVWNGPAGHNGIDSSCFNLTMLTKFQTSKLDQAYYYGCRSIGSWGFMDDFKRKYKVYYGLRMFGDLIRGTSDIVESSSDNEGVVTLAAKNAEGTRKAVLVVDYRAGTDRIVVNVKGVEKGSGVWVFGHSHQDDFRHLPVRFLDGRIVIDKPDTNSSAYLIWF